ncbi:uncharacterized protein LOC141849620 isoform X2 [Brevipalpus obovatus]
MGHINSVVAYGDLMKSRGHHVIFTQVKIFEKIALDHGFEFLPLDGDLMNESFAGHLVNWIVENANFFENWVESVTNSTKEDAERFGQMFGSHEFDDALERTLNKLCNIDAIIYDLVYPHPFIAKRPELIGIPIISWNPLSLYRNGPPYFSGLSTKETEENNKTEWEKFGEGFLRLWSTMTEKMKEWYRSAGLDNLADEVEEFLFAPKPDHFGFYHYPADLDYIELGSPDPGWHRVEACLREPESGEEFKVPEKLVDKPGKLIYFSMGSLASFDMRAMKKMLSILAKSPHRFIVSMGKLSEELQLADNMWGEPFVDQIKVLKAIDMAIIHGGNNSFIETLYFAKPLIIVPYFFDQFDNAQRIEDKGIGKRIALWKTSEDEILKAIEDTLINTEAHKKIQEISNNMRTSVTRQKAAEMIEGLIALKKKESSQSNVKSDA